MNTTRENFFMSEIQAHWDAGKFVCVGLDSDINKIPECAHRHVGDQAALGIDKHATLSWFSLSIVRATYDLVCAYKINTAFFEPHGAYGWASIVAIIKGIQDVNPNVPVILDAKRADIGNTNKGYVGTAFEYCGADAITVNPYLGKEALTPFLERKDKGIIILCRTSNPGANEFQNLDVGGKPLYIQVAENIVTEWNTHNNCAVVVGATCPEELAEVRKVVGSMPILIPGIGAQGGDVEKTVRAGQDENGQGMIINLSRSVIFASQGEDFPEAARKVVIATNEEINKYRKVG